MARLVITAVTVEQRSKREVARDYGVSRVWVQKLVHRYEREGPAAFEPHSRRPYSNPRAVSGEVEDQIVRLRKTLTKKGLDAGAGTIAAHLARVNLACTARRVTTGTQVWDTFAAAIQRWGPPAEVLTDNGAVFTAKQRGQGRVTLEVQLGLRGIRISHSRPYHPQTCGKVERFHQTQKKWLTAQPRAATLAGLQHQLHRFQTYYNTVRPHRALRRATPAQAYAARPKAFPTGPVIPTHYRVRHDRIDTGGSVTLRHNSRLHHIGLGTGLAGTPVTLLVDDLHIRVTHRHTGQLIRELTLDPTRDYQPRGLPPGPPKRSTTSPPAASRSRPNRATTDGVKAGRRPPAGPGLDPGEDGATLHTGMPKHPENATMSRDTC